MVGGPAAQMSGSGSASRGTVDATPPPINRGRPAKVLEVGTSDPQDRCTYSDIDMVAEPGMEGYVHRDGTPYPPKPQR